MGKRWCRQNADCPVSVGLVQSLDCSQIKSAPQLSRGRRTTARPAHGEELRKHRQGRNNARHLVMDMIFIAAEKVQGRIPVDKADLMHK